MKVIALTPEEVQILCLAIDKTRFEGTVDTADVIFYQVQQLARIRQRLVAPDLEPTPAPAPGEPVIEGDN